MPRALGDGEEVVLEEHGLDGGARRARGRRRRARATATASSPGRRRARPSARHSAGSRAREALGGHRHQPIERAVERQHRLLQPRKVDALGRVAGGVVVGRVDRGGQGGRAGAVEPLDVGGDDAAEQLGDEIHRHVEGEELVEVDVGDGVLERRVVRARQPVRLRAQRRRGLEVDHAERPGAVDRRSGGAGGSRRRARAPRRPRRRR